MTNKRSRANQPRMLDATSMHRMKLQAFLAYFACAALGISCLVALALVCLQGFHYHGFRLEGALMHWLGAITLGVIGSLASIVYKAVFSGPTLGKRDSVN